MLQASKPQAVMHQADVAQIIVAMIESRFTRRS